MADIQAKVAQLIDGGQGAFNAGSDEGVKVGDTVRLYRNVQINDPDTKEPLGGVRVPKLNLRVNFVDSKFCVAAVTDQVSNDMGFAIGLLQPRKKVTTSPGLARSDTVFVKIGEEATIIISEVTPDE